MNFIFQSIGLFFQTTVGGLFVWLISVLLFFVIAFIVDLFK